MSPLRKIAAAGANATLVVTFTAPLGVAEPPRVSSSPQARGRTGLVTAFDNSVLMFGGYYSDDQRTHYFGDTWTWDGSAWTEHHPAASPSPRCCFGMAYDKARHEVVLFGGCDAAHYLGDTWTWDGTTWTRQRPATHPPRGCGMGMAYDEASRLTIMFGGEGTTGTWAWDGTTWFRLDESHEPDNRLYPGFAYDHLRSQIVLFGGEKSCFDDYCPMRDTWTYDGTGWKPHAFDDHPTKRTSAGMAFDARRDDVVLFGGFGRFILGDTWIWDGGAWSRLEPAVHPTSRTDLAMAWDPATRFVIAFGGRGSHGYLHDTWGWDGTTWACLDACT